jgi:response regulator RpfG family c-di-GMP phosphodiesterase
MDGIELLEAIRADRSLRGIPVILLTGSSHEASLARARELGAIEVLHKPVDREQLLARIGSVLRLRGFQDQLRRQQEELRRRTTERSPELERARIELIWHLGRTGELHDDEADNHVVRVGHYAYELARELGLGAELCKQIFITSPLHDIGKIGIPDHILLKPGKLTSEEWDVVQQHPRIGAEILTHGSTGAQFAEILCGLGFAVATCPLVDMSARIASHHHERIDGKGYPYGLAGDAIPLEARITAVADVYDALRSRRPYKQALTHEHSLAILRQGAGTQLDADVLLALERSFDALADIATRFADDRPLGDQDVLRGVRLFDEAA